MTTPRALWVDDDQRLLARTAAALGEAGVNVVFAPDLATALDLLKGETWEHVIIDVGIDAGDLESRHPSELDTLGVEQETTGLEFARLLIEAPAPLGRSADSIILCSGFQRDFLQSIAPDLLSKLTFVSKASKAFLESRFISEIAAALGVAIKAPPSAAAAAEFELPYLDLYHDLKVAVRSSLPTLRRVSERFHEYAGGGKGDLEAAVMLVETDGNVVVDEAFSTRGVNSQHLLALEDALASLSEKRALIQVSGYADLIRLADNLLLRAARLPKMESVVSLRESCRALQSLLCAIEIDKVTARLVTEISSQRRYDAGNDSFGFDSSEILTNILDLEEPNALANRAGFERYIDPRVIIRTEKAGQSHLYRRAMSNIIDNAVKYQGRLRENNTWIIVRHRVSGQRWCTTSVESWGAPIRQGELSEIFRPGRRGQSARKQGDGRGLSIAHACVEALGGKITAKSVPGRWGNATNTFTAQIPVVPTS